MPAVRLTWQAVDPPGMAADLARQLGVDPPRPLPAVPGSFAIDLGTTDLELVPWQPETLDDAPQAAGRLVLEPVLDPDLEPVLEPDLDPDLEPDLEPVREPDREPDREVVEPAGDAVPRPAPTGEMVSVRLLAVAWATVDLERATAELAAWLRPDRPLPPGLPRDGEDPHLGARTRLTRTALWPDVSLVLTEPVTEGLVAASLARHDEGPCAIYVSPAGGLDAWLAAARRRSVPLSARRDGPFGPSVVVPGPVGGRGGIAGPHVLVVGGTGVASTRGAGGTIRP
jgi:hypothetical protein